jgi:hypothetical protein
MRIAKRSAPDLVAHPMEERQGVQENVVAFRGDNAPDYGNIDSIDSPVRRQ